MRRSTGCYTSKAYSGYIFHSTARCGDGDQDVLHVIYDVFALHESLKMKDRRTYGEKRTFLSFVKMNNI